MPSASRPWRLTKPTNPTQGNHMKNSLPRLTALLVAGLLLQAPLHAAEEA